MEKVCGTSSVQELGRTLSEDPLAPNVRATSPFAPVRVLSVKNAPRMNLAGLRRPPALGFGADPSNTVQMFKLVNVGRFIKTNPRDELLHEKGCSSAQSRSVPPHSPMIQFTRPFRL